MASLKSIRTRIASVKNTQKITAAMKMVAAAKLRRAQENLLNSRHYSVVLEKLVMRLLAETQDFQHPLLTPKDSDKRRMLLVYSSDRGLCGGFNSNLLRQVERDLHESEKEDRVNSLEVIGKKGVDHFRSRQIETKKDIIGINEEFDYEIATQISEHLAEAFENNEFDELFICFNRFQSAIVQVPTIKKVLPIAVEVAEEDEATNKVSEAGEAVLWEPSKESLLNKLLPRYLTNQIFLAHLESKASELGSRMTAMDNATNNAKDMISKLTLEMNRLRQAAITSDLMDIVNGAEAMN